MFFHLLCVSSLVISVLGEGEIVFLQSPSSVTFQGQQRLPLSVVKDVFSAGLGFSVFESSDWRGMKINDPFSYASAVVGISVPGLSSLDTSRGHKFPLNTDSPLDNTWSALDERIAERYLFAENESDSVYLSLDEGKMPSEIHLGHLEVEPTNLSVLKYLNPEVSYDKQYIEQIALLNSIAKKVEQDGLKRDSVPDVYWIVVSGLHPLIDRYGLKSKPVFEAKQLLDASLQRLTEAFSKAYESKVIIAALASDAPHTRRYRREAKGDSSDKEKFNLAEEYSADFPVMFNIFLWFGIAYAFTLLAVTLGIAEMDPGRDSIIYRMTSNRMKKDN